MSDENLNPSILPENPEQKAEVKPAESFQSPEVAGTNPAPQPAPIQDDKQAVQDISSSLHNAQSVPGTNDNSLPPQDNNLAQQISGGDEGYIKAAENVIRIDKEDPYKEEEDHEDIQAKYLKDRFGKEIGKS